MFSRYVINKVNHRTNCYQGVLVTLGTMKHNGQLNSSESSEVESIFEVINQVLPTPPKIEDESFRKSISWFKKSSDKFEKYSAQMRSASLVLQNMGYEILVLEATHLSAILYEDSCQVIVSAGSNQFEVFPLVSFERINV